jgi:protein TonB
VSLPPQEATVPPSPPPAAAAVPAPSLTAPGGPLQAPTPDAVPAAALDGPLPPTAAGGHATPAPPSVDVEARLFPGTPEPAYPDAARRLREEGSVTLQLKVRADGRLLAVKTLHSSGSPRLDRAARDAAWRWRVLPAERDGRPVDSLFEKTLHFRLED